MYDSAPNAFLLARVRPQDREILDVGCGTGANGEELRRRGARVVGVTWSAEEADRAARRLDAVCVADLERWEPQWPEGAFDALLCSHVLEHLRDPRATLTRLARLLRPGGRAYVAVPNVAFWRQRWELLRGRFRYTEQGILDRTHLRFFTAGSAVELIAGAGLTPVACEAEGHVPAGPLRRLAPALWAAADRAAARSLPGLFGYQIVVIGERR